MSSRIFCQLSGAQFLSRFSPFPHPRMPSVLASSTPYDLWPLAFARIALKFASAPAQFLHSFRSVPTRFYSDQAHPTSYKQAYEVRVPSCLQKMSEFPASRPPFIRNPSSRVSPHFLPSTYHLRSTTSRITLVSSRTDLRLDSLSHSVFPDTASSSQHPLSLPRSRALSWSRN